MKIADLYAAVGFKFDSLKLKEVSKVIGDLNVSSIVAASSLVGLGVAVAKIMDAAGKTSVAMLNLKEATGLDPLRLQQLDVYFQEFGANAGEAQNALYNLNKLRLSVLQGTGNPQPFILTGLSPTTETLKLFEQIHDKFSDTQFLEKWAHSFATGAKSLEEMRAAWKDMIANQFGIPTSMLRGLDQSNEKWMSQFKILGLVNKELVANAEVHAQWVLATNNLNVEIQKLVTNLAPVALQVIKIAEAFTQWLNKTNAIGDFIERLKVIKTYGQAGLMNIDSAIKNSYNFAAKLGNGVREGAAEAQRETRQTNNITLHVSSNTPEEFVKRFDAVWKKYISNADIQFGQQT